MKPILCMLGMHDYVILESKRKRDPDWWVVTEVYEKKICLRCGKVHDEIQEIEDYYKEKEIECAKRKVIEEERLNKAKALYKKKGK
jgi:hypothetical protein